MEGEPNIRVDDGLIEQSSKDVDEMDASDLSNKKRNKKNVETLYSWWIVVIVLIGHVLYYGMSWTVGVYHTIFLEAFKQPAWATSLIGSINTASLYFLAPVGGCLVNRYGCRLLVIVGTLIMSVGLFASFWATNIYVLYVTFGLLAGGGAGIGYVPMIAVLSCYFHRPHHPHGYDAIDIPRGIATSGAGIGVAVIPVMINFLKDAFGWRGSLIMFSATMIQFVFFAAFMKPIHLEVDDDEDGHYDLGEHDRKTWYRTLQLDIFKEKRYLLLCLNNSFLMYGISVVFVHMAAYGLQVGVNDIAWLYAALGLATLFGRIFFGLIGELTKLDFVLVYCLALVAAGVTIVILPHATSLWSIMVIASIFGFGTAVIGPYLPRLIEIFLGKKKMAVGYGYLLVFEGIGTVLGAPSAGTLFDNTQLYDYSFYVGGCTIILSSFILLPAWRWIEPSNEQQTVIQCEQPEVSLYEDEEELKKVENERMHGRSHLTLNQSHDALAESLSRMVSRQEQNRSHHSSRLSLHHSHLSIPRSSSSRLAIHSIPILLAPSFLPMLEDQSPAGW